MRLSRSGPLFVALTLTLLGTGCASRAPGSLRVNHYVFGLAAGKTVDLRDVCASGQADRVELSRTFADYVWGVVTLGMYVPHHVRVTCLKEKTR